MKLYELNYLISTDVSEKEISSFNEGVQSLIKKEGGTVRSLVLSPEKRLAYSIKKKIRAFLTTIIFDLDAEKINLVKKEVKDNKEVLRHLVFKKKDIKEDIREEGEDGKVRRGKKELTKIVKPAKEKKDKVELKKIEEKLEEILNE